MDITNRDKLICHRTVLLRAASAICRLNSDPDRATKNDYISSVNFNQSPWCKPPYEQRLSHIVSVFNALRMVDLFILEGAQPQYEHSVADASGQPCTVRNQQFSHYADAVMIGVRGKCFATHLPIAAALVGVSIDSRQCIGSGLFSQPGA